jgi:hypothetical protein
LRVLFRVSLRYGCGRPLFAAVCRLTSVPLAALSALARPIAASPIDGAGNPAEPAAAAEFIGRFCLILFGFLSVCRFLGSAGEATRGFLGVGFQYRTVTDPMVRFSGRDHTLRHPEHLVAADRIGRPGNGLCGRAPHPAKRAGGRGWSIPSLHSGGPNWKLSPPGSAPPVERIKRRPSGVGRSGGRFFLPSRGRRRARESNAAGMPAEAIRRTGFVRHS